MKKKLVCMSLAIVITLSQVVSVGAAKEDEIKAQKAQTSSQLSAANAQISSLEQKTAELKSEISSIDADLVEIMAQVDILEGEIDQKEVQIAETKEDLKVAEAEKDEQYEAMKKRIQYLYENGGDTAWAQMLLEADDITTLLNKAEYTQKMYDYDRKSLEEFVEVVEEVTELGNQLESDKAELEVMQMDYQEQQVTLEASLEEKKATASDYESQIATVEAQAAEYRSLLEQQTAALAQIEEEKRKAAEAAERAAAAERERRAEDTRNNSEDEEEEEESAGRDDSDRSDRNDEEEDSDSDRTENTRDDSEDEDSDYEEEEEDYGDVSYSGNGQAVVDYATQFVGNPYVWGGTSLTNGADCSGFTMSVFAHFGVSLPHSSAAQAGCGVGVSYADAMPGDLICYSGHVAIYMGGGQIVHASNARDGIKISGNAAYRTIVAVRRVI